MHRGRRLRLPGKRIRLYRSPFDSKHLLILLKRIFKFLRALAQEYLKSHQAIIALTVFILLNTIVSVQASDRIGGAITGPIKSDPYEIAETIRVLGQYIPNIQADPDKIAATLEERMNGSYMKANVLAATLPSQADEPQPQASPSPPLTTTTRTSDIRYVIQIGDTLSGLGEKFDLKLATLKVKNSVDDVDSLKPGQELTIPAQDLPERALKVAEERKRAQALAQSPKNNASPIKRSRNYGLIVPIHHNGITRRLEYGHTGIDYQANFGTPVMAAADGIVQLAANSGWNGGYGKTILISDGPNMTTRYGHLNNVAVSPGEHVQQGTVIGYSGDTGRSTGPHLHFEVRINGTPIDPFL